MSHNEVPVIAGVLFDDGAQLNYCLSDVVQRLRDRGLKVVGTLQHKRQTSDACCDAVELEDLGLEQSIDVTENRGEGSQGCRLDMSALTRVVASIETQIEQGSEMIDLVMVNRFGQAESEGNGMHTVLNSAVTKGVPVLVAVKPCYLDAWNDWHQGGAINLKPDVGAIIHWLDQVDPQGIH